MKKILPIIMLSAALAFSQDKCGSEVYTSSKEQALASLIKDIASHISTDITGTKTVKNGETDRKDSVFMSIQSTMKNYGGVKYEQGKDQNGYFIKACINVQAASKPYLDSLRYLTGVLRDQASKITKESCKNINETYREIENVEGFLIGLGVDFPKEHSAVYKEAEAECKKANVGVYIKSENKEFADMMTGFFKDFGCKMVNDELSATLILNLSDFKIGEGCEQGTNPNNRAYCYACVKKINLQDSKTGEPLYKDPFKSSRGQHPDMETACRLALDKSPQELWNKMKDKIKKENCR